MKRLPSNILRHELIGLQMEVLDSLDHTLKEVSGVIVDETKKTFRADVGGRMITIPKGVVSVRLKLADGLYVMADGGAFYGRPEERLVGRGKG